MSIVSPAAILFDDAGNKLAPAAGTPCPSALAVQGTSGGVALPSTDTYTAGQALADQAGVGGVLTFTFSAAQALIWVVANGGAARADPFGGTPSAAQGIPCADGVPQPITVLAAAVKVYAPAGATVSVWGYRY